MNCFIWEGGKIEGKRERGRPRRQWERDIRNAFDRSITEAGRWVLDRSRLCGRRSDVHQDKQLERERERERVRERESIICNLFV